MYLRDIKQIVNNKPKITTEYFIQTHRACEGYFNRIIFIGLRKKGIKYKQAQQIIKSTFLRTNESLKKGLLLLDSKEGSNIFQSESIKKSYSLFLNFSSCYRNQIEHAAIAKINDEKTLDLCIQLNIKLLRELEFLLKQKFSQSVFDKPKDWDAKRSNKEWTETEIKNLKLGGTTKEPLNSGDVIIEFNNIKWEHKFKK